MKKEEEEGQGGQEGGRDTPVKNDTNNTNNTNTNTNTNTTTVNTAAATTTNNNKNNTGADTFVEERCNHRTGKARDREPARPWQAWTPCANRAEGPRPFFPLCSVEPQASHLAVLPALGVPSAEAVAVVVDDDDLVVGK